MHEIVADRLRKANLTINVEKSKFGVPKLQYIGYVLDADEIHTYTRKNLKLFVFWEYVVGNFDGSLLIFRTNPYIYLKNSDFRQPYIFNAMHEKVIAYTSQKLTSTQQQYLVSINFVLMWKVKSSRLLRKIRLYYGLKVLKTPWIV